MRAIATYREIQDTHPDCYEHKCFFAFDSKQVKEGKEKAGITDEKIYSAGGGLYGTLEGIKSFFAEIDNITARIPKECDPQEVYNYEFANHECGYTGDDKEAIKLVASYFGEEVAKTVKRRCAYVEIDNLFQKQD